MPWVYQKTYELAHTIHYAPETLLSAAVGKFTSDDPALRKRVLQAVEDCLQNCQGHSPRAVTLHRSKIQDKYSSHPVGWIAKVQKGEGCYPSAQGSSIIQPGMGCDNFKEYCYVGYGRENFNGTHIEFNDSWGLSAKAKGFEPMGRAGVISASGDVPFESSQGIDLGFTVAFVEPMGSRETYPSSQWEEGRLLLTLKACWSHEVSWDQGGWQSAPEPDKVESAAFYLKSLSGVLGVADCPWYQGSYLFCDFRFPTMRQAEKSVEKRRGQDPASLAFGGGRKSSFHWPRKSSPAPKKPQQMNLF